ncbi:hypothetical protein D3C74_427680 [compost metagenome]
MTFTGGKCFIPMRNRMVVIVYLPGWSRKVNFTLSLRKTSMVYIKRQVAVMCWSFMVRFIAMLAWIASSSIRYMTLCNQKRLYPVARHAEAWSSQM